MPLNDEAVQTDTMHLFWRVPSPFCQWTLSNFVVDGTTYNCTEQWMMASKALLFNDLDAHAKIMRVVDPRRHKALGRKVRGFRDNVWRAHRFHIVVRGNLAKFTQCGGPREALMATCDRTLVEASPYDRVWGIGLKPNDPRAMDPANWEGENLLGQALMVVRDSLYKSREAN